ncbi:ankyrin repeat domain-containing protein [Campylobacter suis]|uniref:Ankyrin repeat domain-containing protein n=1 Tax=Campylobacter suis TaxID=2790657 RepID=A0ABM8Q151_9BACT|nr:ankyrin repeat domain-containing protein [Campylobacter suis]CAD7286540.1 hypothetical protein LMG8286_00373 [Campylobacter suis]
MITASEQARYDELCLMALDFARSDDVKSLEPMIRAGLNVNLKSTKGDTLLMLASYNNAKECVRMLLAYGASVDERNNRGQTPLAGAAFKGHLEVVKMLVDAGANINANNGMGATPYTFALMFGRREVAKFLKSKIPNQKQGLLEKIAQIFYKILPKTTKTI